MFPQVTLVPHCRTVHVLYYIPLLAEQRVLGECYIVGTTDDRTFCLLWIRVIRLPYLATYEPSKYAIQCACGEQGFCRRRRHFE